jgi:hypothetical protein
VARVPAFAAFDGAEYTRAQAVVGFRASGCLSGGARS